MTQISLPKTAQVGTNEWADAEDNDVAIRDVVNGNLDTANLSATAGITGGQIADAAAIAGSKLDTTDGRLKQTTGLVTQTAQLALTTSYADLTGATVTFTPDVACYAFLQAVFTVSGLTTDTATGRLMVDGVAETPTVVIGGNSTGDVSSASQVFRVALTAAAHTLKLQGIRGADPCNAENNATRFTYQLVAQ